MQEHACACVCMYFGMYACVYMCKCVRGGGHMCIGVCVCVCVRQRGKGWGIVVCGIKVEGEKG